VTPKTTFVPPAAVAPAARPSPAAPTDVPPASPAGSPPPRFVLGFALLKAQVGTAMGDPVENEHGHPGDCDTQQQTTTGLAYWRCSTGTLTFAAAPDGLHHWAWLGDHLVDWFGPSADVPASGPTDAAAPNGAAASRAPCTEPNDTPETACPLGDGTTLAGVIPTPGGTRAYRFAVPDAGAHVVAQLTDLPADYDLYLVDASNAIRGESVLDGAQPRVVDTLLPGGTYYLYVHADPGRDVDPANPYQLSLAVSAPGPSPTGAPPSNGAPGF